MHAPLRGFKDNGVTLSPDFGDDVSDWPSGFDDGIIALPPCFEGDVVVAPPGLENDVLTLPPESCDRIMLMPELLLEVIKVAYHVSYSMLIPMPVFMFIPMLESMRKSKPMPKFMPKSKPWPESLPRSESKGLCF